MIAETKLDETFPDSQFKIEGMKKPYRLNISAKSGGLLVFVVSNISSKRIYSNLLPNDIQIIIFVIKSKTIDTLHISSSKAKYKLFSKMLK